MTNKKINKKNVKAMLNLRLTVHNEDPHPYSQFYSKSTLHVVICNYLSKQYLDNDSSSFEEIVKFVNKRLGSRSTILNCLKEGVDREIFTKSGDANDRRLRKYSMVEDAFLYFNDYVNELNEKLLQQEG